MTDAPHDPEYTLEDTFADIAAIHGQESKPDLSNLPPGTYIATYMNELREGLSFIRLPGAHEGILWHDDDETPHQVRPRTDAEIDAETTLLLTARRVNPTPARLKQFRENLPRVGVPNLLLDESEQQWLTLVWDASEVGAQAQRRLAST